MSIHIYTYYPDESTEDNTLFDNNAYFMLNITSKMIDNIGKEVMQQIDKAILLDENIGTIQTPRGITSIDHLSTGCKVVLNYLYADSKFKFINTTQCGANALEILFQTIEKVPQIQRKLLLFHTDNIDRCNKREYIIDEEEKVITDLLYI